MLTVFELAAPLLTSFIKRPYVFAFLIAYLALAWRLWGWRRTVLWLVSGYAIAWASEYSSIHNGFPYGEYHYIYANMPGELMVAGVPFFDSLSYPFLIFAGYTTATYVIARSVSSEAISSPSSWLAMILGALLTMILDIIIDPLATMGDKWFLGQIHYYAYPGVYFGVPFSNFAGWFLVAFAVIAVNEALLITPPSPSYLKRGSISWLYPAFFVSIALFNIAISFWIGEWKLGAASSSILGIFFILSLEKN